MDRIFLPKKYEGNCGILLNFRPAIYPQPFTSRPSYVNPTGACRRTACQEPPYSAGGGVCRLVHPMRGQNRVPEAPFFNTKR